MASKTIAICDQHLLLLPERAVFWRQRKWLLIADPHFGKAASFRAQGIAIPRGSTVEDLNRLSCLIAELDPRRMLIVGDLLHARSGKDSQTMYQVHAWRQRFPRLPITLISGNHDQCAGEIPAEFQIDERLTELVAEPFRFNHTPAFDPNTYTISGHLHPAVRLSGPGRQKETFACYYFGSDYAVLPAFGSFTGLHLIKPKIGDRIYLIADGQVLEPATTESSH